MFLTEASGDVGVTVSRVNVYSEPVMVLRSVFGVVYDPVWVTVLEKALGVIINEAVV